MVLCIITYYREFIWTVFNTMPLVNHSFKPELVYK